MAIKTEKFKIEVSNGSDVYFGSITSGQVFKRWEDIGVNEANYEMSCMDLSYEPIDLFSDSQWLRKIGDKYDYLLLSVCDYAKNDI
jgi:hypothetical protein